jgi:hypothetical protein
MNKQWTKIIFTSKLSKAFCDFELEAKIVFDVDGHHFKPSMEIIFFIDTLQFS